MKEWLKSGAWCELCLILFGDASKGKTTFAKTICYMLAVRLQKDVAEPFYISVKTVDSLREGQRDGLLVEGVPILYDDLTPGLPRGTRPCMSLDDVKHFTEVENASSVNARNNDINFAANMPKIVTTNATNLHEWHKGLPQDVYSMSNEQRLALTPDVKAVLKRVATCLVSEPLMDLTAKDNAKKRRRLKAQSLMADAFD